MKRLLVFSLAVIMVLGLSLTAFPASPAAAATTYNVDDNWPAAEDTDGDNDFATIQAAIGAATSGDTVQVAAGTYNEDITLVDGVMVLGAGAAVTTIQGTGGGPVVYANNVGPSTKLDGFTITNGSATYGGGIYNYNSSSPTVTNCILSGNSADYGGGMANRSNSSPMVTNCTFDGNSANNGGGGMFNYANSSPVASGCIFTGNSADYGGGMYNDNDSSPTVLKCTFSGNSAGTDGGGMYNDSPSAPTVTNCVFYNNCALKGGGMFNRYNYSPEITNCTFSGNSATIKGGGMYNEESSPTVTNCIFWENGDELYSVSLNPPTVTYSDVKGGYPEPTNININPMFVNQAGGNLHLRAGSPCIDTGTNDGAPTGDIEDNQRPIDGDKDGTPITDMGAYEYVPPVVVGGEVFPASKLAVVAPYLLLVLAITVVIATRPVRRA